MDSKPLNNETIDRVSRDGFALVPGVFAGTLVDKITQELSEAFSQPNIAEGVLERSGTVCAARNVLQLWPAAASVWRQPPLPLLLREILGAQFGLVRVLFFDKPPENTWGLPWHKDMTIAVRDHQEVTGSFRNPTRKAGVPHVEASRELLDAMLTIRIHLDDVTETNGPMKVIPGSHLTGKTSDFDESLSRTILAKRGDALLIRPLVMHSSIASASGSQSHRRILHLEFAGWPELPDGYKWHDFVGA